MANIRWLSGGNAKYVGRAAQGERICTWGIPAWITPHGTYTLGKNRYVFKKKDVRLICFGAAFKQAPPELTSKKGKTFMRKMKGVAAAYPVNPGRGCIDGCFARVGQYAAPSVKVGHMKRYRFSLDTERFVREMTHEIQTGRVPQHKVGNLILPAQDHVSMVRIHDSGDFHTPAYLDAWLRIIENCPKVFFFTYTKSFTLFKKQVKAVDPATGLGTGPVISGEWLPSMRTRLERLDHNFALAFSEGSKWDLMIDPEQDRHSRIFRSVEELESAGYSDCSRDDAWAFEKRMKKIGLVFHGNGTPFTTDPRVKDPFEKFTQQTHRALVKRAEERGEGEHNPVTERSPLYPDAIPLAPTDVE